MKVLTQKQIDYQIKKFAKVWSVGLPNKEDLENISLGIFIFIMPEDVTKSLIEERVDRYYNEKANAEVKNEQ